MGMLPVVTAMLSFDCPTSIASQGKRVQTVCSVGPNEAFNQSLC